MCRRWMKWLATVSEAQLRGLTTSRTFSPPPPASSRPASAASTSHARQVVRARPDSFDGKRVVGITAAVLDFLVLWRPDLMIRAARNGAKGAVAARGVNRHIGAGISISARGEPAGLRGVLLVAGARGIRRKFCRFGSIWPLQ